MTVTEERAEAEAGRQETLALAAALVTVVLWASAFVGIRAAGEELAGGPLALARLLVAGVALGGLLALRPSALPGRGDIGRLVICGVLWFGIYNIALNEAERRIDAGTAAMLVNVGPVFIALLAGAVLHEGFPRTLLVGMRGRLLRRGADRRRDRRRRPDAELGRGAVRARRRDVGRRRRGAEAAARAQLAADGHVPRLPGRRRRLPPLRAVDGRPARRRERGHDRVDRLPRRGAHGDRVHDVGLRAVAHERRPDGLDDLPRPADRHPPRLADPRPRRRRCWPSPAACSASPAPGSPAADPVHVVSARAITSRWMSDVPSSISSSFASRIHFSTGCSRE